MSFIQSDWPCLKWNFQKICGFLLFSYIFIVLLHLNSNAKEKGKIDPTQYYINAERIGGKLRIEKIDFETQIIGSRMTHSFSPDLFFRGFLQWNSDDKELSVNLLLNYIYKLGSDFYLVYNELWEKGSGIKVRDRIFLAKIAHLFYL